MSDVRLRYLQRAAQQSETDPTVLWSYIRELERVQGLPLSQGKEYIVPFKRYVRVVNFCTSNGEDITYTPFNEYQPTNGMSFFAFPFRKHYSDAASLVSDLTDPDDSSIDPEQVCGYALIDSNILELLENVPMCPGGDSASDAIAYYKVAFSVAHSHFIEEWKYELDDYDNRQNSGWKLGKFEEPVVSRGSQIKHLAMLEGETS